MQRITFIMTAQKTSNMIGKESADANRMDQIKPEQADKDEEDLQNCILSHSDQLLLEELLLLGEEVEVGPRDERIDILALDEDLNSVIIEIKNRTLKRKDIKQAMKYAPYISKRDTLEDLYQGDSKEFQSKLNPDGVLYDEDLNTTLKNFSEKGSPNNKQRIFLVGTGMRQTAGDMAHWLRDQGVPLKIINITGYEDTEQNEIILTAEDIDPDEADLREYKEWERSVDDAKSYHRKTRASETTRKRLDEVISAIKDKEIFIGPDWQQKNYISFSDGDTIRIKVRPRDKKVKIWLIDNDIKKYRENELIQKLDGDLQITFNTEDNRIEFELTPNDAEAVEPLVDFACDELV